MYKQRCHILSLTWNSKADLIRSDKNELVASWRWQWLVSGKVDAKESGLGVMMTAVYICQNLKPYCSNYVHFVLCKLCLLKMDPRQKLCWLADHSTCRSSPLPPWGLLGWQAVMYLEARGESSPRHRGLFLQGHGQGHTGWAGAASLFAPPEAVCSLEPALRSACCALSCSWSESFQFLSEFEVCPFPQPRSPNVFSRTLEAN